MDSKHTESRRTKTWTVSGPGFTGNNLAGSVPETPKLPGSLVEAAGPTQEIGIREAAALLAQGGLVAFPTETVYGLGADARNTAAVEGIFAAKGRPSDNPLIVHIADRAELDEFVSEVSEADEKLMKAFWPGPLTLVLPVRPGAVSPKVTAGLDTVAVRMPDHGIALALIRASGCPLAAPSANRSGRPSPTLASHVREDLDGRIDGIVDGGPAGVGVESTVVRTNAAGGATVLRPGGIPAEELGRVLGAEVRAVSADPAADIDPSAAAAAGSAAPAGGTAAGGGADGTPRSPGMKYAHYAPSGRLEVVLGAEERTAAFIREALAAARARGEKTGVLAFDEHLERYRGLADVALPLGSRHDLREAASRLYAALRRFDEEGATYMLAEGCGEEGIGSAVMNRMGKAAGGRIHRV